MSTRASDIGTSGIAGMLTAAAMIAQQVAGKATRDALFLSNFHVTQWPNMLVTAALVSIAVALLSGRFMSRLSPRRLVPAAFGVSAALLIGIWAVSFSSAKAAAIALSLHTAILAPVLISGYWSAFNERFDPRTARRQIVAIGSVGALGGVAGGLVAMQVASASGVSAMLPVLAVLHLFCAAMMWGPTPSEARPEELGADAPATSGEVLSGLQTLLGSSYLRDLGTLIVLVTVSAALIDYVFRVYATESFRAGRELMSVFSWFYIAAALLAFLVQITLGRIALDRVRVARTAAMLPAAVVGGSIGVLAAPSLITAGIARGLEMAFRNSVFRSGYELLYTPVAPELKRPTKALVDVGFERFGDALGGALVVAFLLLGPGLASPALIAGALAFAILGLLITLRLHRGYIEALQSSLVRGATSPEAFVPMDLSQRIDVSTLSEQLRNLRAQGAPAAETQEDESEIGRLPRPGVATKPPGPDATTADLGRFVERLSELRSGDPDRIRKTLSEGPLTPEMVPHVLPLLAQDEVAADAAAALRAAAPVVVGQLVDALLDPARDLAVRRRIPRILAACESDRAVQGLFQGLEDPRFEIRLRCGRALAVFRQRAPDFPFDRERVLAAVLREVAVERHVWEGQREIQRQDDPGDSAFVDEFLRRRANASLEHVFTLMSLSLAPQTLLRIAFTDLHSDDAGRRGTALEYLECVLPPVIRGKLWVFLEDHGQRERPVRPRDAIIADLLRTNESIRINLAELRKLQEGG